MHIPGDTILSVNIANNIPDDIADSECLAYKLSIAHREYLALIGSILPTVNVWHIIIISILLRVKVGQI